MELVILTLVLGIFFVGVPAVVGGDRPGESGVFRAAAGFLRVSLFFRIVIMFAGLLGAIFPGIIVALWSAFVAAMLIWSRGKGIRDVGDRLQGGFLRVLGALETRPRWASHWPKVSRAAICFCVLAAATLIERAWFPLHNLRFAAIETYSRAVDLQRFMHRDTPVAGGVELILAPLGFFSGLYPDSVIRFSGPLFSTVLVLAVGLCALRFLRSSHAALIAAALIAVWPVVSRNWNAGEITDAQLAAVYWVLAASFIGRSPWLVLYGGSTALLVSWKIAPVILAAAVCVVLAWAFVRVMRRAPAQIAAVSGVVVAIATMVLFLDCRSTRPDGPLQYEAAARACRAIATEFPRNEWLIVSPVHELAFIYGRGWHFELVDFVSNHTPTQIARNDFVFPYDVADIFVFVEKNPLRPSRPGQADDLTSPDLTQTMDRAVLAYNTGLGRASIEFQAGALLSAYASSHAGVSIYREDERLVVFHLKGRRGVPAASSAEKYGS